MADINFEDIQPFVEGQGDTGKTAREKINRNFQKLKGFDDVKSTVEKNNLEIKGVGVESEDAIYTKTSGYVININSLQENAQGSYSSPIALSKGATIIAKMYCGFLTAIAITNASGTTYRRVVNGEGSTILKDYKYTALEDCYVAICWRNIQSDPEYVKIITNGTLNEILNLYKDVELNRKFLLDSESVTNSGQRNFQTKISPTIKAGTKVKIKAIALEGSWSRLLVYYNGNTSLRLKDGIVNDTEYTIVLTDDVYSLGYYVTTDDSVTFSISIEEYTKVTNIEDNVKAIENNLSNFENYVGSAKYVTGELKDNSGCQVVTDTNRDAGTTFFYSGAKRTYPIPVEEGKAYETNAELENAFGIGFYDTDDGTCNSTTFVSGLTSTTNGRFTIPVGVNYIIVSDRNGVGSDGEELWVKEIANEGTLTRRIEELESKSGKIDISFQDYCNRERMFEEYCKNPFVWKKFDKAYFSWTNDDARPDMYLYQDLCEQYNFPYCPAVPWESIVSNPTINGTPLIERLLDIVENGGEILMHSVMVLNTESPFVSEEAKEQWYKYFRDSKELTEKALNVRINGFILAGGSGESIPDKTERQKWYLTYYKYADRIGGNEQSNVSTPQLKLGRWRRTTDDSHPTEDDVYALYVAAIDDAVINHKWLRFYCHGTSEVSISLLTRVFDYIQTKINNQEAEFVTWNYMYEKFKGSQLDKLINPNDY